MIGFRTTFRTGTDNFDMVRWEAEIVDGCLFLEAFPMNPDLKASTYNQEPELNKALLRGILLIPGFPKLYHRDEHLRPKLMEMLTALEL